MRLSSFSSMALALTVLASIGCTASSSGSGGSFATGDSSIVTIGADGATSTHAAGPSSAHAATSVTSTQSGAGGGSGCEPAAAPGSIYEKTALNTALDNVSMCQYRGDVMLIVDTAGACGYTPQMAGLEAIEKYYAAQSFHVLGFYENDFANQGGDPTACSSQYMVTFPEFALDDVKGPTAQPVWQWLLAQNNPGPAPSAEPTWNFNKYLISKDGQLIAHWEAPEYWPVDTSDPTFATSPIIQAIDAELAK